MTDRFETKDSGARAEFGSGMVRDTEEGKARFDMLIPKGIPYEHQMLTRFADLLARGAEKYTERNWEKANSEDELARYYSSANRHFMQWITGETDEDHAAAVFFNIMAAETVKYKMNNSDRSIMVDSGGEEFNIEQINDQPAPRRYTKDTVFLQVKPAKKCRYEGRHQGTVCFSDGDMCSDCGWTL